jgi:hypothetical protein
MDWLGPCRRLRVGRALNDDKCATVPFLLMHTTHLPFRLVGFALPFSCMFLLSVLVYCLGPTNCVFSLMARESVSFTSHPPVSLLCPCLTFTHAHSNVSRTSNQKKKIPSPTLIPVSASISHKHTFSHETSPSLFFCLYYPSTPFFSQ